MKNLKADGTTCCPNCREYVIPEKISRGSSGWMGFWLIFVWPVFVIYFMLAYGYNYLCPLCGHEIQSDRYKGIIIMGLLISAIIILIASFSNAT